MSTESPEAAVHEDNTAPLMSRRQIWLVFGGLMLGMLLTSLDQTVSTAMWTIVGQLDPAHGVEAMPWLATAYLLAAVATQPLFGKLADSYGPKPLYLVAIGLFVIGSAWAGMAGNLSELIAARAVQGLGAGGSMVLAMAVTAVMVPADERGKYVGFGFPVMTVASVVGPLLGGFFTQPHGFLGLTTSWRWIFYLNLPIGLLCILVVATILRTPAPERVSHRIDYLGAGLLVSGTSALLIVAQWGGTRYPWTSATIIGLAAIGLVLIALFFWWQGRAAEPIIPLRLFSNRTFRIAAPITFIVGFANFGSIIYIALYLQVVEGQSPTVAGLNMLPLTVGLGIGALVTGQLVFRLHRYRVFGILGSALATITLGLLGLLTSDTPLWVLSVDMFLFGVGLSQLMQIPVLAVQKTVPITEMGVATAGVMFPRLVGGSFGTAVLGALMLDRLSANLPAQLKSRASDIMTPGGLTTLPAGTQKEVMHAFVGAMHTVFIAAAATMLLVFALTLMLREPSAATSDTEQGEAPVAV
ncbi:MDR family MFS transporter [Nocardia sp. NPDC046473]|uniref:MDR family MFS transporter n=1 Tax=Nocardia sp. NPDC046473 TaxID=3155733 RepID=UPI0033DAA77F